MIQKENWKWFTPAELRKIAAGKYKGVVSTQAEKLQAKKELERRNLSQKPRKTSRSFFGF